MAWNLKSHRMTTVITHATVIIITYTQEWTKMWRKVKMCGCEEKSNGEMLNFFFYGTKKFSQFGLLELSFLNSEEKSQKKIVRFKLI